MPKDQLVIDPQETPITYSSIVHSQKGYTNGLFVLLYELVLVWHEKDAENSLDVMKGGRILADKVVVWTFISLGSSDLSRQMVRVFLRCLSRRDVPKT